MEKLLLVFESEKNGVRIKDMIEGAGMAECHLCHSAAEAKRLAYSQNFSIVVCGYKFYDGSAEALLEDMPEISCALVIAPQSMLELLCSDRIWKLPAPATRGELLRSVQALLQMQYKRQRGFRPGRSDAEKEAVEDAKKRLMAEKGMTEGQAHRYLQKKSMDTGAKMTEVAYMVLDGSDDG